jgi:hypothetical protein
MKCSFTPFHDFPIAVGLSTQTELKVGDSAFQMVLAIEPLGVI